MDVRQRRACMVAGWAGCGVAAIATAGAGAGGGEPAPAADPAVVHPAEMPAMAEPGMARDAHNVLFHEARLIDGTPVKLEQWKGKVLLIVNVASKCGLTPQYAALEKLYREHKDAGLVVLAFPANDFMGQEPGSNEEIASFCSTKYDVTFPMFAKISVKGDERHDLYEQLVNLEEPLGGEIEWNFAKFLVGRDGRVAARFKPQTKPDDPKLVAKVRELLAAGAAEDGERAAE